MLTPEAIAFVNWTCGIVAVAGVGLAAYGLCTLIRKVLYLWTGRTGASK